jgi:hypothetical protein
MTLGTPIGEKTAGVASSLMQAIQSMSAFLSHAAQVEAQTNVGLPR